MLQTDLITIKYCCQNLRPLTSGKIKTIYSGFQNIGHVHVLKFCQCPPLHFQRVMGLKKINKENLVVFLNINQRNISRNLSTFSKFKGLSSQIYYHIYSLLLLYITTPIFRYLKEADNDLVLNHCIHLYGIKTFQPH